MSLLLDASVLVRATPWPVRESKEQEEDECFISTVTAAELLQSALLTKEPSKRAKRVAFVEALLDQFPLVPVDRLIARMHAEIQSQLRAGGKRIPLHDSWLAATCLAYDLRMATARPEAFAQIQGLALEKWS
jgi:predicted nucleic acid-binding protein